MTSHPDPEATSQNSWHTDERVVWVIKPSTLCNLRCEYCYEWEHLAEKNRIALDDWPLIFAAVKKNRELWRWRLGRPVRSHVVLQGGEPLLLPTEYLLAVAQMHRETLGSEARLSILSNLVVLSDELLQLLSNTGVAMGVSWDGVEDARLDLAGKPTHLRVLKNMRRLGEAGIRFGVNLVLGAHNHRLLPEIHDQILNLAAEWWAIHPVFRSTTPESVQAYVLSPAAAASSLGCLYRHWVIGGRAVCVQPLMRCERIVQGGGRASREMLHPRVFVRPDLQISLEGGTSSPTMILGSLRDGRTSDFQGSPTFEAALSRLRRQDSSIAEKLLCELLRNELQCNEISRFPDAGQGCLQHSV